LPAILKDKSRPGRIFESGDAFLEALDPPSTLRLPDCLMLVLHMTGRNGLGICAALQSTQGHLPLIGVAGKEESGTAGQVRASGAARS
jgi:CheY-like chemotaxis protein